MCLEGIYDIIGSYSLSIVGNTYQSCTAILYFNGNL